MTGDEMTVEEAARALIECYDSVPIYTAALSKVIFDLRNALERCES